jgi:TatD DNase family protein
MEFVDIGINLAHDSYDADREAVLRRAADAGVTRLVVTGSSADSNARALELARAHPQRLHATAGCHPHHAADWDASHGRQVETLAAAPEVVAVGECGLDYFRDFSPRATQRDCFAAQLEIAARLAKPVFLHQRDAHADFVDLLRPWLSRIPRLVAHCFTGNRDELACYLDLGLYIGITGWICDERRGLHLREIVPLIPAGRLMLETDGPYLLPRDLAPRPPTRRNEPAYLPHVARAVATARGEPLEALAEHTTRTALTFFEIK